MIRTGNIESWTADPSQMGPLYPFVGWEPVMFGACLAFCVAFTVWKFVSENAKYDKKVIELRENGDLHQM
jgi:hypothetical protein